MRWVSDLAAGRDRLQLDGKAPGAITTGAAGLVFSLQPSLDQRHCDGLLGAARDVDPVPFARQDAVETVCRLRARSCEVGRVHGYRCGMWGLREADALRHIYSTPRRSFRTEGEDPMFVYGLLCANPQLFRPVDWRRRRAGW